VLEPEVNSEFSRGLALHQQGRLADAESIYLTVLRHQPAHARAWHLLGVIALQSRRPEQAIQLIDKAIALNPDYAEAYNNRGAALTELGRHEAALASYDRAVTLKPDYPQAHNNRGTALANLGRPEAAMASFDRAIELNPSHAEAYSNRGAALVALGRPEEALSFYDRAIAPRPDDAAAHNNRGAALVAVGRAKAALAGCDKAIGLKPDYAEPWHNRGNALRALGRTEDALSSYDRAIVLRPDHAETHNNRGATLADLRRPEEALAAYDHAVALKPDYAEAHNNRGSVLRDLGRFDDALLSCDRAIELRPDSSESYYNRANASWYLGRQEAALTDFEQAIALNPDEPEAHWNQSLCQLSMGDFENGWKGYEWRWKAGLTPPNLPGRLWLGDFPIDGKTILVHAEQGSGDSLHFCRYLPLLAARATVILGVPWPLTRLLGGLEGVSQIVVTGGKLPPFDAWIPMMSLPLAFRTTLETIPAGVPYLHADPEQESVWRRRLAALPGRKIGLVWAGAPRPGEPRSTAVDRRRSMALQHFAPLAGIPGLCFVSLQKGEPGAQTKTPPDGLVLHDWTDELNNFADTAALIEALDLVISVDTSVAHLAGAMGKPVWILNRYDHCWRWLRNRTDSPWYPTARLFRQPTPGDWASVIDDVAKALRQAVLELPRPLTRLLAGLRGAARIVVTGDPLPRFDAWTSMISLPLAFRTTLATIPAEVPYLYADPEQTAAWRRRLSGLPGRKIGLVWAGSPELGGGGPSSRVLDRRRSIPPDHFAPLAAIPDLSLISLQKGEAAAQAAGTVALHDWTSELTDFADTAALVEALDLVITVDTAVAHLAGALGKPVWILSRYDQDWRWLRDRTDSPWYPTARLFQQRTPGDWAGVIRDVAEELRMSLVA
jgi:tetratricopeptide (TPR) repeat protein